MTGGPHIKEKEKIFKELYEENFSLVQYFICSYLKDMELSKDTVQEVFVSVWNNFNKLEKGKEKNYMLTIARNKCLNILKHNKITAEHAKHSEMQVKTDYLNLVALESTTKIVMRNELEGLVNTALKKMPQKISSTFSLSKFKALKNEEIAQQENISIRTVEYRLKKAILILKEELRDYVGAISLIIGFFI